MCEALGVLNVTAKILGNRNKYSVAYATLDAFRKIESPYVTATRTGRRVYTPLRPNVPGQF
jgi:ribosomal protein S5